VKHVTAVIALVKKFGSLAATTVTKPGYVTYYGLGQNCSSSDGAILYSYECYNTLKSTYKICGRVETNGPRVDGPVTHGGETCSSSGGLVQKFAQLVATAVTQAWLAKHVTAVIALVQNFVPLAATAVTQPGDITFFSSYGLGQN